MPDKPKKILAVCPNPSIDVTVSPEVLSVGALNRVKNPVVTFSGKAINAIKAASLVGSDGICTGFMFRNDAESYEKELDRHRISSDFVILPGDVRKNIKICEKDGRLTEINSEGTRVDCASADGLLEKTASLSRSCAVTLISGSLPAGLDSRFYRSLTAASMSRFTVVDAEKSNLLSALEAGCTLIKPNLDEAFAIVGISPDTEAGLLSVCQRLVAAGAAIVLLSLGERGAVISDGSRLFAAVAPHVPVKSTVGAGDSMVGVCADILAGHSGDTFTDDLLCELLTSAVAAGSAAVQTAGTGLFEKSEYERLKASLKAEKISR